MYKASSEELIDVSNAFRRGGRGDQGVVLVAERDRESPMPFDGVVVVTAIYHENTTPPPSLQCLSAGWSW
jgi:hypothetical protein